MKRKFLPRPIHAALCILGILLILYVLRLSYGPPPVFGEEAMFRRLERQYLREAGTRIAHWSNRNEDYYACWDGKDILVYYAPWNNKVTFVGVEQTPVPKPIIRRYSYGVLARRSHDGGWGCPGCEVWIRKGDVWVGSLPILVKNDDPAVKRGELTVTARDYSEDNNGYVHKYTWQADAGRMNPWVFVFELTPWQKHNNSSMLYYISSAYDPGGISASAEIVWYDEGGAELYRQQIELIGQGEGSEEYGA